MRILLVEDDVMVGAAACKGLRQDGFAVDWVQDGKSAELALQQEPYALLLLDLGLPQKNGLAVLQGLRSRGDAIAVLITTARDAVSDRVAPAANGGQIDRVPRGERVTTAADEGSKRRLCRGAYGISNAN